MITVARTVNNNGESDMDTSRICPRVFLHIELNFPSDRENFPVEMGILLSLMLFGSWERGATVGKK